MQERFGNHTNLVQKILNDQNVVRQVRTNPVQPQNQFIGSGVFL